VGVRKIYDRVTGSTVNGAVKMLSGVMDVWADQQDDAKNSAF
jgi:hypothetical protein